MENTEYAAVMETRTLTPFVHAGGCLGNVTPAKYTQDKERTHTITVVHFNIRMVFVKENRVCRVFYQCTDDCRGEVDTGTKARFQQDSQGLGISFEIFKVTNHLLV